MTYLQPRTFLGDGGKSGRRNLSKAIPLGIVLSSTPLGLAVVLIHSIMQSVSNLRFALRMWLLTRSTLPKSCRSCATSRSRGRGRALCPSQGTANPSSENSRQGCLIQHCSTNFLKQPQEITITWKMWAIVHNWQRCLKGICGPSLRVHRTRRVWLLPRSGLRDPPWRLHSRRQIARGGVQGAERESAVLSASRDRSQSFPWGWKLVAGKFLW